MKFADACKGASDLISEIQTEIIATDRIIVMNNSIIIHHFDDDDRL